MEKVVAEAKFEYDFFYRDYIERCEENKFSIYSLNSKENTEHYIKYGENVYKVNFIKETLNIIFDKRVISDIEKYKILNTDNREVYTCKKIVKVYKYNYESFNYVKKNKVLMQPNIEGVFINPKIIIKEDIVHIEYNGELIGKVYDYRSKSFLSGINKSKDLIYVNNNIINIFTLKKIEKDNEGLKIIIYEENRKVFTRIKKAIEDGCRINDEIWLFFIEDKKNNLEGNIILKLPNNKFYNCILEGNELRIKNVDKRKFLNGTPYALVKKVSQVEYVHRINSEIDITDEKEKFNSITSDVLKNNDFIRVVNEYKEIENKLLEQAKEKCKPIKYISLQNNKFIICESCKDYLEEWANNIGIPISVLINHKSIILGTLKEVSENYIKVDFKDDMIRGAISKQKGELNISLIGDEVIQKRRENAIRVLENDCSALENLAKIISGNNKFEDYSYKKTIPKYEIGNLAEFQIKAIEGVFNSPDIYLIQGPPGTGKTTVIRRIVQEIINSNKEVLITSYQNLAVDNVLDGFLKENVIPFRFGTEINPIMDKICNDIVGEISNTFNSNISFKKEEELNRIKDRIQKLRSEIVDINSDKLEEFLNKVLQVIKLYEGEGVNYLKLQNLISSFKRENHVTEIQLDRQKIISMMPVEYNYDFEVIEAIEQTEEYLHKINLELNSNIITSIIKKLKNLQNMDVIFSLQDSEYKKIKYGIYDQLSLIKNNKKKEVNYFKYQLDASLILDNILENMPIFIENNKFNIIKSFYEKINKNPILIEDILKKYADIRGTTCQKIGSKKFNDATNGINYDYVIVDEAARANPLDLLIPLIKGKKVVLVGDHKQLPHMLERDIESKFRETENYDEKLFNKYIKESLFGRLYNQLPDSRKVMLDTQYRMTKEIGELVSELFYDGNLKTGTNIVNDTLLYKGDSLIYIDVKGREKKILGGSFNNKIEAEEIIKKIKVLNDIYKNEPKKVSVGIISFYKSQVEYIKEKVRPLNLKNIDFEIGTVDAYQGLEKDIIFISSVRTNGIGFISNPNRLNVSLSRAKKLVVLFGDISNLQRDELFKKIIARCKNGGEN